MRDPNRIEVVLELIRRIWVKYPDLRLGQLLINLGGFSTHDNFHLEDEDVIIALLNALDKIENK